MPPITPLGKLSLTKFLDIDKLLRVLADLNPASDSATDVEQKLDSGGSIKEMFNDIVGYQPPLTSPNHAPGTQLLVDDELLRAARDERGDAHLLVWCALLLADKRIEAITREILTGPDGRFRQDHISREKLHAALLERGFETNPIDSKMTTNILSNFANCKLFVPQRHGGSIIGVGHFSPTSHAVPGLLQLLADRLRVSTQPFAPLDSEMLNFALSLGANHWLGLTPAEFRSAAAPKLAVTQTKRSNEVPKELVEIARQLSRKRQIVLQGPPGSGKTYLAKQYVDWATGNRRSESRLQEVLEGLPYHDRTVERVADEVERLGLVACWDIVQIHPSYEYTDFVRALVATPVAGGVSFTATHRILSFISGLGEELTRRGSDVELVLILDELNRGNVAAIFGELLYALEYRGEPVATPYEIDGSASITVPESLRVIGTMNTADRSIALIDYALRRRFVFLDVPSSKRPIENHTGFHSEHARSVAIASFECVNDALASAPAGIRVGPSYFLPASEAADEATAIMGLAEALVYEVLPLLAEYEAEGELEPADLRELRAIFGIDDELAQNDLIAAVADAIGMLPAGGDLLEES